MVFTQISYAIEQSVAIVTLTRPHSLNAWTPVMRQEVRRAMKAATDDDNVRVIVLTGAGRGFCAGVDMHFMSDRVNAETTNCGDEAFLAHEEEAFDNSPGNIFDRRNTYFATIPKPIIAAINGPCAGIGLCLALFCDMRFAAEDASFTTAFARRGLIAEHGISWTLPRLVGLSAATDLLMTARKFLAPEALELGLIDRMFPASELMSAALTYAKELGEFSSPRSLRIIKKQLWLDQTRSFEDAMNFADHEMELSLKSEDHREGIKHFLEKRSPAFTGK